MENNGKTAKLFLTAGSTNVPTITSSHLSNDIFKLAQLHFHWGNMDKYGSEHTIDGLQFPIELHLVHFNTKYGETMEEALSVAHKSDNLAVLGVLFEITRSDMSILDPLINKLRYIQQEGTKTCVKSLVLKNLLPLDLNTFYSYEGSLTTPKCNEIVTWTVFKKRHSISSGQLDEFRKLISKGKPLVNNYRDIQNLNSRKVDFYSA
ncbi:CA [Lepeophtheirus salmonis]|uniref:Carbonic anhydrase n=2 Tax=Lepeophtheirus salmonis TaxID=72036 RepID=A0A7R8H3S9_LEPSM|nr:CA [Lepeophtheirus salmonis]CAF2836672.1 CA [Lepeophtheirus salmonis]